MHNNIHFYGEIPSCEKTATESTCCLNWRNIIYSQNFHVGVCLHESTWDTKIEMGVNMALWKRNL